jgi:hypothetical protein
LSALRLPMASDDSDVPGSGLCRPCCQQEGR